MARNVTISLLDAAQTTARVGGLSAILMDCVEGGASVSFMAPLSRDKAEAFWRGIGARVAVGAVELLVADIGDELVGTVQLVTAQPENQPHRADVAKMLVHRTARRQGVGRLLLIAAEERARQLGKTLLVLDTASDEAERLYRALAWTPVGRVPGYALFPDGRPCDTIIFYKTIVP